MARLLTFEDFRFLWGAADGEPALRQEREFLRDDAAAEELLDREKGKRRGWAEWPDA